MSQTTLLLDEEAENFVPALMEHFGEKTMNGTMNALIKSHISLHNSHEEKKVRIRQLESEYARLSSLLVRKLQVDREIADWAKASR